MFIYLLQLSLFGCCIGAGLGALEWIIEKLERLF